MLPRPVVGWSVSSRDEIAAFSAETESALAEAEAFVGNTDSEEAYRYYFLAAYEDLYAQFRQLFDGEPRTRTADLYYCTETVVEKLSAKEAIPAAMAKRLIRWMGRLRTLGSKMDHDSRVSEAQLKALRFEVEQFDRLIEKAHSDTERETRRRRSTRDERPRAMMTERQMVSPVQQGAQANRPPMHTPLEEALSGARPMVKMAAPKVTARPGAMSMEAQTSDAPPNAKRVLVVDDSELTRLSIGMRLAESGYLVMGASNSDDFSAKLKTFKPQLVVADMTVGGVSVEAIFSLLHANTKYRDLPVVLFSAADEGVLAARAGQLGAHGFVSKTRGVPALIDSIGGLFESERAPAVGT